MKIDISEKLWDKNAILRVLVGLSALIAVFVVCLMVLAPFVPSILLALILTLATWPAFRWLEAKLNHKTTLAATIMTLLLIALFVAPLLFVGSSLLDNFRELTASLSSRLGERPVIMPEWVRSIPIFGSHADAYWIEYIQNKERIPMLLQEHSGTITKKLLANDFPFKL